MLPGITISTPRAVMAVAFWSPVPRRQQACGWITMPASFGFDPYTGSGLFVAHLLGDALANHTARMFLNRTPPISTARKIGGLAKSWGDPQICAAEHPSEASVSFTITPALRGCSGWHNPSAVT